MLEAFIGTIMIWSGSFPPRGWAFCNGQIISICQNQALFALISTTYGGDGRTIFALPDLRSRVAIGNGTGVGISEKKLGQRLGVDLCEQVLTEHRHILHNLNMNANTSTKKVHIELPEITIESTGLYGIPITDSLENESSFPTDSKHYLGKIRFNDVASKTYVTSKSIPKITTKHTVINESVKVKPKVTATFSGDVNIKMPSNIEVDNCGPLKLDRLPIHQPSLAMNYIICMEGWFPPRKPIPKKED